MYHGITYYVHGPRMQSQWLSTAAYTRGTREFERRRPCMVPHACMNSRNVRSNLKHDSLASLVTIDDEHKTIDVDADNHLKA
jgi:hypothetical protein